MVIGGRGARPSATPSGIFSPPQQEQVVVGGIAQFQGQLPVAGDIRVVNQLDIHIVRPGVYDRCWDATDGPIPEILPKKTVAEVPGDVGTEQAEQEWLN